MNNDIKINPPNLSGLGLTTAQEKVVKALFVDYGKNIIKAVREIIEQPK